MKRNIIVISGPENSGKTTTVKMMSLMLRNYSDDPNNADTKYPNKDYWHSTKPIKYDRELLIAIPVNGKMICLASIGDSVDYLEKTIPRMDNEWHCDYMVCCCRDKGPTYKYMTEGEYKDRVLEWYSLPKEPDFERRRQNEIDLANIITAKILELCGKQL